MSYLLFLPNFTILGSGKIWTSIVILDNNTDVRIKCFSYTDFLTVLIIIDHDSDLALSCLERNMAVIWNLSSADVTPWSSQLHIDVISKRIGHIGVVCVLLIPGLPVPCKQKQQLLLPLTPAY